MIKKILLLLVFLLIFAFFIIFYLIDKIYINKVITNMENDLNINISLEEPHKFNIIPNLSLLTKFNLDKKDKNLFVQGAELSIVKNYDNKHAIFNFKSNSIKINKLIIEDLESSGEINEYNFKNLLKFKTFPNGYFYYNSNKEEKNSLKFINLIINRLNVPEIYKKLSELSFALLNEKSFFTSEISFDDGLILIDYFESKKNDFHVYLYGKYNLLNEVVDLNIIIKQANEKIVEIKISGISENPNIKILSADKTINLNFFISDFNQLLESGFENILKSLVTSE